MIDARPYHMGEGHIGTLPDHTIWGEVLHTVVKQQQHHTRPYHMGGRAYMDLARPYNMAGGVAYSCEITPTPYQTIPYGRRFLEPVFET